MGRRLRRAARQEPASRSGCMLDRATELKIAGMRPSGFASTSRSPATPTARSPPGTATTGAPAVPTAGPSARLPYVFVPKNRRVRTTGHRHQQRAEPGVACAEPSAGLCADRHGHRRSRRRDGDGQYDSLHDEPRPRRVGRQREGRLSSRRLRRRNEDRRQADGLEGQVAGPRQVDGRDRSCTASAWACTPGAAARAAASAPSASTPTAPSSRCRHAGPRHRHPHRHRHRAGRDVRPPCRR